jgi:hypothetical protein
MYFATAKQLNTDLIKTGRSTYKTQDGRNGYVITTSKMYTQGNRGRYWFAYRRNPLSEILECEKNMLFMVVKMKQRLLYYPFLR